MPAAVGMAHLTRRGARRLGTVGLVLVVLGGGLSGLMATDYYDVALATTLPMDQAVRVFEAAGSTAGAAPMLIQLPSVLGTMLGTILLAVAMARAGFVRWWTPAVLAVGSGVFFLAADWFVGGAAGTGLMAVATALLGARMPRADDEEWASGATR